MEKPLLYDYWRSSASYRVRIALNLKGFDYDQRSVHLVRDGGEQHADDYRSRNPQGLVPTLVTEAGNLTQSLAIIEYLEEVVPEPALLPGGHPGEAGAGGPREAGGAGFCALPLRRAAGVLRPEAQQRQPVACERGASLGSF